ncbi:MAG: hypothetical protein R3Y24_14560 [Eubacteriales bacterium]
MKKIISVLLSLAMMASLSATAFASEPTVMSQSQIKSNIIQIVADTSSDEERDDLLVALLEENPLEPTVQLRSVDDITTIDVIDTVKVNENIQVDFYSTGDFGIMETEKLDEFNRATRADSTGVYRTSYEIKNLLGGKIVETYVKGEFTYDGINTPTPYLEDAGYSKGVLIMWDCSSWEEDVKRTTYNKKAFCYADAYYDWSLDFELGGSVGGDIGGVEGEVNGSVSGGLTIQDCNVYLKLICDKDGNVSATVSVED